MTPARALVAAVTLAATASACGESRLPAVEAGGVARQAVSCASLTTLDLIDLRLTEAEVVAGEAGTPPHCRVAGVAETEIRFELLLPDDWNGRLVMGGGGGFVGSVQNQAQSLFDVGGSPLARGYATVGTDTGHVGGGIEASWALDHPERQENFGHRAVHVAAEAAKSVLRHYYGDTERYSYFVGCSRGGGQAMMASQRYPEDFDGIVAAAPAYHWTGITAQFVQTQQAVYPTGDLDAPVIRAETLTLLAEGIDAACDTLDGVDDDVLTDPRACGFDPGSLPRCPGGEAAAGCVTEAEVAAIRAVYAAPTSRGESIYYPFPFGGENEGGGWHSWVVGGALAGGRPSAHHGFGTELFKYFVFRDPEWDYTTYDFSTWAEDTAATGALLNATSTELGPFRDRGGKIIFWTGWSDLALTPLGTIDYYERLREADPVSDDYARLYLLPGVLHCQGGAGADRVDWLEAIRAWVEDGAAPGVLEAERRAPDDTVELSRPACPYPEVPVYDGAGDPTQASSFSCAVAAPSGATP